MCLAADDLMSRHKGETQCVPSEYSEIVPIQYERGKVNFHGMELKVDPRVFIPRPETELLVEKVLFYCGINGVESPFILDLCTGSGAVAIALAGNLPRGRILAADISKKALEVAADNVLLHDMGQKVKLVCTDMFSAFKKGYEEAFDCIVSNPPYVSAGDYEGLDAWVKAEPKEALYSGENGLDHLEVLALKACSLIKPGGFIALEIGYDQSEKVKDLLFDGGFTSIEGFRDMNGYQRVITGWKNG